MRAFPDVDLSTYDTDKSELYLRHYERELGHLVDEPVRILELGIRRGGSLYLWRDLFPLGHIAGLDMLEVSVPDDTGRVRTFTGYQQDPELLDRIAAEVAPEGFDIIIDDASHLGQYTADSFRHLFPRHLKAGGIYVLEDWSCGYWPHWPDGHGFEGPNVLASPASLDLSAGVGRTEQLHRRLRSLAPVVSEKLGAFPALKERLRRLYMRAEGSAVKQRFTSHDYGMVGFVKQLVDACAIDEMNPDTPPVGQIETVHVAPSQVFVHKRRASTDLN